MSVKVLVQDRPHRTLALATDEHVLIFHHVQPGTEQVFPATSTSSLNAKAAAVSPRCLVEFLPKTSVDIQNFRLLTTAKGSLGLITLNHDVFICMVTGSAEVATVRPGETVQNIFAVEFCRLINAVDAELELTRYSLPQSLGLRSSP